MIHSLDYGANLLAAACGDGSLAILQQQGPSLVLVARIPEAHSGPVAQAIFPWPADNHRLLASVGNDQMIVLWDLGTMLCPDDSITASLERLSLADPEQPRTLLAWSHTGKPNWMVSGAAQTLMVADTSKDITVYSVR